MSEAVWPRETEYKGRDRPWKYRFCRVIFRGLKKKNEDW